MSISSLKDSSSWDAAIAPFKVLQNTYNQEIVPLQGQGEMNIYVKLYTKGEANFNDLQIQPNCFAQRMSNVVQIFTNGTYNYVMNYLSAEDGWHCDRNHTLQALGTAISHLNEQIDEWDPLANEESSKDTLKIFLNFLISAHNTVAIAKRTINLISNCYSGEARAKFVSIQDEITKMNEEKLMPLISSVSQKSNQLTEAETASNVEVAVKEPVRQKRKMHGFQ